MIFSALTNLQSAKPPEARRSLPTCPREYYGTAALNADSNLGGHPLKSTSTLYPCPPLTTAIPFGSHASIRGCWRGPLPSSRKQRMPAVHAQHLAIDEARLRSGEEGDGVGD